MMMRVKDSPEPPAMGSLPPGNENLILHTSFRIGDSVIMASDCGPKGETEYKGFSLTLTVPTDDDAVRTFNGLADGGQVLGPLTKTFFSSKWGVLKDKFGISWMVMVAQQTRPAGA
jgi:PhnB protein